MFLSYTLGRRLAPSAFQRVSMIPRVAPQLGFSPLLVTPLRTFSSAATTLNIDATESPQEVVPIKINVLPTVSEYDLLDQQLEKARNESIPECWYPRS